MHFVSHRSQNESNSTSLGFQQMGKWRHLSVVFLGCKTGTFQKIHDRNGHRFKFFTSFLGDFKVFSLKVRMLF